MRLISVIVAIVFQGTSVYGQGCIEDARDLAEILGGAQAEAARGGVDTTKIDSISPEHGQLELYRFENLRVRFAIPECRIVDFSIPFAKPQICVATEQTTGGWRVIPQEERIERCSGVSVDAAESSATDLFSLLVERSVFDPVGFSFQGTELLGCGGGFCYLSRWINEQYIDKVRVAIASVAVWTNAESGDVYRFTLVENEPERDGVIAIEDAERAAVARFKNAVDCKAETVALARFFDSSGTPQRFWITNVVCDGGEEPVVVYVDAVDGRLIPKSTFHTKQK